MCVSEFSEHQFVLCKIELCNGWFELSGRFQEEVPENCFDDNIVRFLNDAREETTYCDLMNLTLRQDSVTAVLATKYKISR